MGSPTKTVLLVMSLAILDVTCSSLLLIHGNKTEAFTTQVFNFTFQSSLLDLWSLSIVRFVILIGATIGVLRNPVDGPSRIRRSSFTMVTICVAMVIFVTVKLLVWSESPHWWYGQPWFWSLMVWTLLASLWMYCCWILLGTVVVKSSIKSTIRRNGAVANNILHVNVDDTDQEHLVGSDEDLGNKRDESDEGKEEEEGGEEKKKGSRRSLLRLLSYSRPDWMYIMIAFAGLLIASSGEIFLPLYTGKVIDGIVVEKDESEFTKSIIIMSAIAITSTLAGGLRAGMFKFTMARLDYRISNLLLRSILKQEIGFFDVTRTGDITSRLTSDTSTMSESLGLNMNIFLRNSIQIIGYIVMMLGLSWRLTVLCLIAIPLMAAISDYYGDVYERLSKRIQDSLAAANSVAEEAVSTMRTVRSFANEHGEAKHYSEKLKVTFRLRRRGAWLFAGYMMTNQILELMFDVCTLFYGGHLVLKGVISGGQLVSFILYSMQLGNSLSDIANVYTGLMEAAGASVKVFELMDRQPNISNEDGQVRPADLKGHIEFKNVTFGYPSREDSVILKDVSFTASPGEVVALVGPSGGGKSTCVSLIQHFYEPQTGSVMLDGIPVSQMEHAYLHSQVAMVGQEPILYARSIHDNIRYGLDDCSKEMTEKAAKQANAHGFISEMKDGYDTETGEKGMQLSGGQKQRVAIARALVRNPKVLLLDEATSALDAESEHAVQQALYQHAKDRTILIVAHRLSTVEKADRIVVIDHGRVLEQGSHQQLIRQGGMYAQLVQRQLLAVQEEPASDEPITSSVS